MTWFILGLLIGFFLGIYFSFVSRRKQIHKEKQEIFNHD